jgi:hypothetical protein
MIGNVLGAKRMKQVLLLSYHWPPNNYVGTVRPSKLAKFLPRYGWLPVVLTVEQKYYDSTSPQMPADVSSVPTIRTGCLPNPRAAYVWVKGRVARMTGREALYDQTRLFDSDMNWRHESPPAESALRRIKRSIVSLLHTPDDHQGWLPFAVVQSLRVLRQRGITCVITTGPPFTTHLVGLAIKKLSRVSWIADFRDPWSLNTNKPFCIRSQPGEVLGAIYFRIALEDSTLEPFAQVPGSSKVVISRPLRRWLDSDKVRCAKTASTRPGDAQIFGVASRC